MLGRALLLVWLWHNDGREQRLMEDQGWDSEKTCSSGCKLFLIPTRITSPMEQNTLKAHFSEQALMFTTMISSFDLTSHHTSLDNEREVKYTDGRRSLRVRSTISVYRIGPRKEPRQNQNIASPHLDTSLSPLHQITRIDRYKSTCLQPGRSVKVVVVWKKSENHHIEE